MTTVTLKGPFTEADLRHIVLAMQAIEAKQPQKNFSIFVDAPELQGQVDEIDQMIHKINPPRPGYTRTMSYWNRDVDCPDCARLGYDCGADHSPCRCGHTIAEHHTDACRCSCG